MTTTAPAASDDELPTDLAESDDDEGSGSLRLHVSLDEKIDIARAAAGRIFELIGAGTPQIDVSVDDEQIVVRLRDLPTALSASADARILESIQFLLNKAVNKLALRRSRLSLDADGFRRRRPDNFDELGALLAARVAATGRAMAIGPLGQTEMRLLSHQIERAGGVLVRVDGPHDRRRIVVGPKMAPASEPPAADAHGEATDAAPPVNGDGGRRGKRHRRRH
ncbi:MAG: hypothetical protein FJ100_10995 [Deltaproteobacteria bacterium]|nr:hypothetical protein [Deltaproteobacteria bacterium]